MCRYLLFQLSGKRLSFGINVKRQKQENIHYYYKHTVVAMVIGNKYITILVLCKVHDININEHCDEQWTMNDGQCVGDKEVKSKACLFEEWKI